MPDYSYSDGDGLTKLDKTTPAGNEPVSTGDDALRQIKAFLRDTVAGLASYVTRMATVEASITALQATAAAAAPTGGMMDFVGSSAPTGWLVCDGSAVSRSTYSALFAITGVAFGAGNGTTTFNIPDCRSRVTLPSDGGTARIPGLTQGSTGGAYQHALTANENGPHTHDVGFPSEDPLVTQTTNPQPWDVLNETHWSIRTATSTSSGTGTPHNNLQPYLGVATRIIKT